MRYTRNRQLAKLYGNEALSCLWRDEVGTDKISDMLYWDRFKIKPTLDLSFKWNRDWYSNKNYNMLTWDSGRNALGTTYHYSKWGGLL